MPSLEELRDVLGSEAVDAMLRDYEESKAPDESAGAPPAADNSTVKSLRDAVKRAEQRARDAEKERDSAIAELTEKAEAAKDSVLAAAGLSPRQAEVFKATGDEASPDNIAAFKRDVLGVTDEGDGESGFGPVGTAGESAPKQLTRADLKKLPAEEQVRLVREGKVAFGS